MSINEARAEFHGLAPDSAPESNAIRQSRAGPAPKLPGEREGENDDDLPED